MFGWIKISIVIIIVFFLSYLEKRIAPQKYVSLTPFKFLSYPFLAILVFQQICIHMYSFEEISTTYILCLVLHFLVVWIVDIPFLLIIKKDAHLVDDDYHTMPVQISSKIETLFVVFGLFISIHSIYYFLRNASGLSTIGYIVQEDFQRSYSENGGGLIPRLICMMATIYFFSAADKTKKRFFVFGIICLIPNALTFVKGIIFINIVGSIIGNCIVHNRQFKFKQVFLVGFLGVIILYTVYLVEISVWHPERALQIDTYKFIFGKLVHNLVSGPQAFNIQVEDNVRIIGAAGPFAHIDNIVFAPFINVIAKLGLTTRIETISSIHTYIGTIPSLGDLTPNVYSYIGELVMNCGIIGSLFVGVLFSVIINCYYYLMWKNKNPIDLIMYALFGSFFVLGWFDDYFTQTFWLYLIIISTVFKIVSKYMININGFSKIKFVIRNGNIR